MPGIRFQILSINDWLIRLRRDIHQHPGLGYQVERTAELAADTLADLGLEVKAGVGRTGVIGLWRAKGEGRCLGLRADMDALPIDEPPGRKWRSKVAGVMHACGHDVHTAMLLGVARTITSDESLGERLGGTVKFIFQPAEEGGAGAAAMIVDGVLEDPPLDGIFATHVLPLLEVGQAGYTRGVSHAAVDNFFIEVKGRGGHAAHPRSATDPLAPAARLVGAIKARTRDLDQALVAVCRLNAGTETNIIPDRAELSGTIRSLDPNARDLARDMVRTAAAELEKEPGLQVKIEVRPSYPMLENDEAMLDLFVNVAGQVVGPAKTIRQGPSFGAEDMAYFLQKVPGANYWLGCAPPGQGRAAMLHSPEFDPDEAVMPLGVEMMVSLAEAFLGSGPGAD